MLMPSMSRLEAPASKLQESSQIFGLLPVLLKGLDRDEEDEEAENKVSQDRDYIGQN